MRKTRRFCFMQIIAIYTADINVDVATKNHEARSCQRDLKVIWEKGNCERVKFKSKQTGISRSAFLYKMQDAKTSGRSCNGIPRSESPWHSRTSRSLFSIDLRYLRPRALAFPFDHNQLKEKSKTVFDYTLPETVEHCRKPILFLLLDGKRGQSRAREG